MHIQSITSHSMPDDYPPVTEASIAAALAAQQQERDEARKAAAKLGWDLRFDTDGRPYLHEPDETEAQ